MFTKCSPAASTKDGTYHWLADMLGTQTIARWEAGSWRRIGTEALVAPQALERIGFRYLGLAAPPVVIVSATKALPVAQSIPA